MASKFYAVRQGRKPGIYTSWPECQEQVHGYPNADFKSFAVRDQALAYLQGETGLGSSDQGLVAYVDGSFDRTSGLCAYGLVMLRDGEVLFTESKAFHDPDLALMHNVAGELAGARRALAWAIAEGEASLTLAYDYAGIEKWCTGSWQANKPGTKSYRDFCQEAREHLKITFLKVKGHSGDPYNDMADALAKAAIDAQREA